jgi:hypothetical protein
MSTCRPILSNCTSASRASRTSAAASSAAAAGSCSSCVRARAPAAAATCEYTRARCHSSLECAASIGILHTNEDAGGVMTEGPRIFTNSCVKHGRPRAAQAASTCAARCWAAPPSALESIPRVISNRHFSVQLNHFIPGFLSYSVPVFLR